MVRFRVVAVLAALSLGCGGSPTGPVTPGTPFDFAFDDPAGDTLAPPAGAPPTLPPPIDLIAVRGSVTADQVTITLQLADAVSPWSAQVPSSLDGFVDLDLDENAATGIRGAAGASAGIGAELYVDLRDPQPDRVALVDTIKRSFILVPVRFEGATVTVEIPRSALGDDDGQFTMSVVVGVNGQAITDVGPGQGAYPVHRPAAP